jgi:Domain of Unknown Function (DUF1080)
MNFRLLALLIVFGMPAAMSQTVRPDLSKLDHWRAVNRKVEVVNEDGKQGLHLNALPGDGMLLLNGSKFTHGTIEFDVKGKNLPGQSFVGLAFHVQDEKTYDAIYFRPFNFMNSDPARQSHSVQYISQPTYGWEKLRTEHPGKYENTVSPVPQPDGWFHVRVVVDGNTVSAFVNNSDKPSLEVEKIGKTGNGNVAFWVGNNSEGSFANLMIQSEK